VALEANESVSLLPGEDQRREKFTSLNGTRRAEEAIIRDAEDFFAESNPLCRDGRQSSAARQFVPIRVVDVAHPGEFAGCQDRSDPRNINGESLEHVSVLAVAAHHRQETPSRTILVHALEVGRGKQRVSQSRVVESIPDRAPEALTRQLSAQKHSDHLVFADPDFTWADVFDGLAPRRPSRQHQFDVNSICRGDDTLSPMTDATPDLTVDDARAWSQWLSAQGTRSDGVLLLLAKKGAVGPTTLTYEEALEEAICHGWVDGQLTRGDEHTYRRRFTPRRSNSAWSKRNVAIATRLVEQGRMHQTGLSAIEQAKADGRWKLAYAGPATMEAPADLVAALKANPVAEAMFGRLSSANRYSILYRVTTAKRPETRQRRIEQFVDMLARGETIHPQR
jgi:uncharacterized protein YdeI (YjbR/CyaY-like superfamily)